MKLVSAALIQATPPAHEGAALEPLLEVGDVVDQALDLKPIVCIDVSLADPYFPPDPTLV